MTVHYKNVIIKRSSIYRKSYETTIKMFQTISAHLSVAYRPDMPTREFMISMEKCIWFRIYWKVWCIYIFPHFFIYIFIELKSSETGKRIYVQFFFITPSVLKAPQGLPQTWMHPTSLFSYFNFVRDSFKFKFLYSYRKYPALSLQHPFRG